MDILQITLSFFIFLVGWIKIFRVKFQIEHWTKYKLPFWLMTVIGILEVVSGLALFGGLWYRHVAFVSAAVITMIVAGASYTHFFRANQKGRGIATFVMICLFAAVMVHNA